MAVRTATRRWPDLGSFLKDYPTQLKVGALVLPSEALEGGEPAPELKIDLVLPLAGRVGPVVGQVVAPLPDGAYAVRIPEMPDKVQEALATVFSTVDAVKDYLVATRQVGPAGGVPAADFQALKARVAELEAALARAVATPHPGGATLAGGASRPAPVADGAPVAARGFAVPDLTGWEPALSGALADRSLRDAFMALAVERVTGLLVVRNADRVRYGFWSKGGPVGWRSDPIDEQEVLGVLLWRAGTITKEQLERSLEIMETRGCRQGDALIEMGVLSFPQVVVVLQKQTEFVLQRVMRDRSGTWEFHTLDELSERFLPPPLRVASLLYKALLAHVKDMPAEELASALRPWLDQYVWVAPGVEKTLEEMKLNVDEQAFVKIIGKTIRRLREVFSVSSLSRSQTAAFIWCLQQLNLIEFRAEGDASRGQEQVEKDIQKRKRGVDGGTLFDRLELHWICTADEVEANWRRLGAEYHPDTAARVGEQHRAALEHIHAKMREAYDALRPDAKRREYRASVIERTKVEQSAEMLAKQGEMAIMKVATRDALNCWGKAVELMPGNPEFREGLGRAKQLPS